jgi:hypothetical protein
MLYLFSRQLVKGNIRFELFISSRNVFAVSDPYSLFW